MSDIDVADSLADSGEPVEAVDEVSDVPEAPPQELIDFETYGNHYVPITVDGEETTVPLSELQQGYQRHADYTRKTQEIASERERLAQAENIARALERDPEGTIRVLQAAFQSQQADTQEPEFLDPMEQKLQELTTWKEQQEMASFQGNIERQLEAIHREHGVDPEELVQFATENHIPNLEWALWGYQQASVAAKQEFQQKATDAEAARTAAKRGAVAVEGGHAKAAGSVVSPTKGHGSIGDAYQAAMSQLGYS